MAAKACAQSVSYHFSGNTSLAMGNIPGNTPFTGTFTYNFGTSGVTSSYDGGTATVFSNAYSTLTLTIGGSTVSETVPGAMELDYEFTPPGNNTPDDALYTFNAQSGAGPNASTGTFASYGLTPDDIYLSFYDTSATAFSSGTTLPSTLNLPEFDSALIGVDYGPEGAGNTDTVSNLKTLTPVSVPEPNSLCLTLCAGVICAGMRLRRTSVQC